MKKFFLMVIAAMMVTTNVNAQDEKNEIGVFYGFESASNIFSVFTSAFAAAAGDQSSWWGPIGAEYYYHLTPGVAVGGNFRGFVEAGLGEKGVLCAGLRYKF